MLDCQVDTTAMPVTTIMTVTPSNCVNRDFFFHFYFFITYEALNWSRSSSVRVRGVFYEPAPEHGGSVQPVVALEPAHQVQVHSGLVRVHTGVHLGS